jgi:hypothetical protein
MSMSTSTGPQAKTPTDPSTALLFDRDRAEQYNTDRGRPTNPTDERALKIV